MTTDDTIESLAYAVCNTDGADGLSWREVEACEVSKNKSKDLELYYLVIVRIKFLELKCLLGNHCSVDGAHGVLHVHYGTSYDHLCKSRRSRGPAQLLHDVVLFG